MWNQNHKALQNLQTSDNTPVPSKSSNRDSGNLYGNKSYKVAIYCRLSVEDIHKLEKGDDSESIQNQKLILMDYAMSQGWCIYKVYSDDDYSGLDKNRPDFNRMITDAENSLFHIILCKTQSRFTRDMELVEKYIHGLFAIWGIRFVSVVDNVDTAVKGNKKARQIYGLINEWYCEDLSENIRAVFKRKMESGQFIGSFSPYGYQKDSSNRHRLIIDPPAADVVREIFSLYLQGYGYQYISNYLTEKNVKTPTAFKKEKGEKFENPNSKKYSESFGIWANNTIRRILQNKVYIGTLVQGREKKISYKNKRVVSQPKEKWIEIPNSHEAIISERDFYTVQGLISSKRRAPHRYGNDEGKTLNKNMQKLNPLSAKIKCAYCGSNMQKAAPTRDKKSFYVRCANHHKTKQCQPNYVLALSIEALLMEKVQHIINICLKDEKNNQLLQSSIQSDSLIKKEKLEKELFHIESRLIELSKLTLATYTDKVNGLISNEDFINFKTLLSKESLSLTQKKESFANEMQSLLRYSGTQNSYSLKINQHIKIDTLSHEIVNILVDFIEASKEDIIIHWFF